MDSGRQTWRKRGAHPPDGACRSDQWRLVQLEHRALRRMRVGFIASDSGDRRREQSGNRIAARRQRLKMGTEPVVMVVGLAVQRAIFPIRAGRTIVVLAVMGTASGMAVLHCGHRASDSRRNQAGEQPRLDEQAQENDEKRAHGRTGGAEARPSAMMSQEEYSGGARRFLDNPLVTLWNEDSRRVPDLPDRFGETHQNSPPENGRTRFQTCR